MMMCKMHEVFLFFGVGPQIASAAAAAAAAVAAVAQSKKGFVN
jgi:hypothetical protein